MAIRKRNLTGERSEKSGRLRHPLLKIGSNHLAVFNYIKANPGSGRKELEHITTSGQPITDLMREGLIIPVSEKPFKYRVVEENETGYRRDQVLVKLTISVNRYGEYSVDAKLVGQKPTALEDFPNPVAYKDVAISIPNPGDPYAIREVIDINERIDSAKAVVDSTDFIDVDFKVIE